MQNHFFSGTLLLIVLLSGCEQITPRVEVLDYVKAKYDIYEDLERSRNTTQDDCQIDFIPPEQNISVGNRFEPQNRQADASQFQSEILRQQGGASDPIDNTPPPSTTSSSSSRTTFSPFFDDGEFPADDGENNTAFRSSAPSAADNNFAEEEEFRTYGEVDNVIFTLTLMDINPSLFTDIEITHPSTASATLEASGIAQLTMKDADTRELRGAPYDSVDVIVKYYLRRSPQGSWICSDRKVDFENLNYRRSSRRGGTAPSSTIIRW